MCSFVATRWEGWLALAVYAGEAAATVVSTTAATSTTSTACRAFIRTSLEAAICGRWRNRWSTRGVSDPFQPRNKGKAGAQTSRATCGSRIVGSRWRVAELEEAPSSQLTGSRCATPRARRRHDNRPNARFPLLTAELSVSMPPHAGHPGPRSSRARPRSQPELGPAVFGRAVRRVLDRRSDRSLVRPLIPKPSRSARARGSIRCYLGAAVRDSGTGEEPSGGCLGWRRPAHSLRCLRDSRQSRSCG